MFLSTSSTLYKFSIKMILSMFNGGVEVGLTSESRTSGLTKN